MEALRPEHYLEVAQERIRQAELLYQQKECYALAMYLAGLAVECMLRAFKARKDRVFDERHDLKRLFQASGIVDFVQDPEGDEIRAGVNSVHVMWSNYLRYASEARLRIHLRKDPVLRRRVKGDILKASALRLVETARRTVSLGVSLWTSS